MHDWICVFYCTCQMGGEQSPTLANIFISDPTTKCNAARTMRELGLIYIRRSLAFVLNPKPSTLSPAT